MNTIPRVAHAETVTDALESAKELEAQLKDLPDRGLSYAKYVVPLFTSPSFSIRKSAFNSALSILSNQPTATDQLLSAYESALSNPDSDVAKHAISYLPQFVALCKVNAKQLISIAIKTTQSRAGFVESSRCIGEAMDVAKNLDRIK